jgi:hypothetical protein
MGSQVGTRRQPVIDMAGMPLARHPMKASTMQMAFPLQGMQRSKFRQRIPLSQAAATDTQGGYKVKTLRPITGKGAEVPKGTMGTLVGSTLTMDDGSELDATGLGLGKDFVIAKEVGQTRQDLQKNRDVKDRFWTGVEQKQYGDTMPKPITKPLSEMDPAMKEDVRKKVLNLPGISGPMGFFDPLGLSSRCSFGRLLFYREAELKHGRVCMLASLGIVVGEQFHPLFGGNIDVPSYVAFQETPLQKFWPAVLIVMAAIEKFSGETFGGDEPWSMKEDRIAGDFNFDPLGLKPTNPAEFKELQTKELNNGRLAMLAAAGMIAQELATKTKIF